MADQKGGGGGGGGNQEVDISNFTAEQLQMLQKQLAEEYQLIQNSYANLKIAQGRFASSAETLNDFKAENDGKEMLVPLTSSMYIVGSLATTKNVLVDVGTGYFVQKKIPDAKKYLNGKVDMLRDQLENVSRTLVAKRSDLETVSQLFNDKAARVKQQQQQQMEKLNKLTPK